MNKETFEEQVKKALSECKIIDNGDGTLDINGNLSIKFPLQHLPKIKNLIGHFSCIENNTITNLIGSPTYVSGNFYCSLCYKLKSLKGAPKYVGGDFSCFTCNALKTLEDAPQFVCGNFDCSFCNKLTIFKLKENTRFGNLNASYCNSLKTNQIKPKTVRGELDCSNCKSLPTNEKTYWLKKQEDYIKNTIFNIKRNKLETIETNQEESTWKHTT